MSARCPKDSDLVRLSTYETSHDESERLFRHLAVCRRCSTRYSVLLQVKRDLRPAVEAFAREVDADRAGPLLSGAARQKLRDLNSHGTAARPRTSPVGFRPFPRFAAGFLAILAVFATGAYLAVTKSAVSSRLRSPADSLILVEPAARVPQAPRLFRWFPVTNAESYVFELYDDSLERVHTLSVLLINELVLPREVRDDLVGERTYLWTVSAYDEDSVLLASQSGSFVIE